MQDAPRISIFTPSNTPPHILELIMVQRQQLLQDAVERVKESALTGNKHHQLFVGPRGCGKTYLATLIVYKVGQDTELLNHLRIAWLNEDETSTSLLELLIRIHAALMKRHPDDYTEEQIAPAFDMKPAEALDFVKARLLESLGRHTLMVVVENLDLIFEGLGDTGQKQLRSFIQENPRLCFVATAQRLTDDLSNRDNPFFGFFQTEHLKPLNVQEAAQLLQNITGLDDSKKDVVQFLATSRGRARVRALHHLSGGNHRIYIVLSQFITGDNVEALVAPFMKMVDELTPYYQERLRSLPPLQRRIVEYLCTCERTVPVKDIAKRLFTTPPTISSQLQDLREKGYADSSQRGRESLYEISEPLMRICVEVKDNQRLGPLRLLVDFLRVWYEDKDLEDRLGLATCTPLGRAYLEAAIERNLREGNLRKHWLIHDLRHELPESLSEDSREELLKICADAPEAAALALEEYSQGRHKEAFHNLNEAISQSQTSTDRTGLLICRLTLHNTLGNTNEYIEDLSAVIQSDDVSLDNITTSLIRRGIAHVRQDKEQLALEDFTHVITLADVAASEHRLASIPVKYICLALVYRADSFRETKDNQRAIDDYTRVIEFTNVPAEWLPLALLGRADALSKRGDKEHAIEDLTKVIGLAKASVEHVAIALLNRGVAYAGAGDLRSTIADCTQALTLTGISEEIRAKVLCIRALAFKRPEDTQQAIDDFTQAVGMTGISEEVTTMAFVSRGIALAEIGEHERAIKDFTMVISSGKAPIESVARALINRGLSKGQLGDKDSEIENYTQLINMTQMPDEAVARALINRGLAFHQPEDMPRAINDFTQAINFVTIPDEQRTWALLHRGTAFQMLGDTQYAINDYTMIIGMTGASLEHVAMALYSRALCLRQTQQIQAARLDFERILSTSEMPSSDRIDSSTELAKMHWSEGRWSEGMAVLEQGLKLRTEADTFHAAGAEDLIHVLYAAGLPPQTRSDYTRDLFVLYKKYEALMDLGGDVVSHIGAIYETGTPFPSADNLEQWYTAWESAGAGEDEFKLPLRLLRTGIDFIKTGGKDMGVLLDLTSPERTLMKQALGLAEPED